MVGSAKCQEKATLGNISHKQAITFAILQRTLHANLYVNGKLYCSYLLIWRVKKLFNPHILKAFTKTLYFHCSVVFYTCKREEVEVKYLKKYSNMLQIDMGVVDIPGSLLGIPFSKQEL